MSRELAKKVVEETSIEDGRPVANYMYHVNEGNHVFIKERDFFVAQGGLTQSWGKHWKSVEGTSIGDARRKAAKIVGAKICIADEGED